MLIGSKRALLFDSGAYLDRLANLFGQAGVVWPVNDKAGRTAYEWMRRSVSLELLDDGDFETAGAGGADVFASWAETAGTGAIEDEGTLVHGGDHAAKLTAGSSANTLIKASPLPTNDGNIPVRPGTSCALTFWTRGDGTNAGRYQVYDVTNGAFIRTTVTTSITGTTYTLVTYTFTVPDGCYAVNINLVCPSANGGIAYFDDVSLTASDYPMDGVYQPSGITYGVAGIGDGNMGVTFNGTDTAIQIGSRAFDSLWNGDKFSAVAWAMVDGATRWTDATTYRYPFHVRSRTDANYYVVMGKSQTDHQLAWRRRVGGLTNEQTYTFSPTGPLTWFCMGMTYDQSIPRMRGFVYAPSHTPWTRVFDVAGDGIAWGTPPVDSSEAVLFAGSLTAQEWIGSGGPCAYVPGVMLTDEQMFSAMVP